MSLLDLENFPKKPKAKEDWHSYGLQSLSPQQFLRVVSRIIDGEYRLLNTSVRKSAPRYNSDLAYRTLGRWQS